MPCKLTMPMKGSCKAFCSRDLMERKTLTCKHNKNANPHFQQIGGAKINMQRWIACEIKIGNTRKTKETRGQTVVTWEAVGRARNKS